VAAAHDRAAASADRRQAARDRQAAGLDELTGVLRRGAGEQALLREIERAHRSGRPLTVAVLDVDALKAVNDRHGHAAGDALLRDVATAVSATMRAYDLAIRWGGDEFVCALSDATIEVAADRVADVRRALAARQPGAAVSVGIAAFEDADSLESVVARADADLYRAKARRQAR
jgi:diguanylate cyclase (GGDEF)-like protein